MFVDRKKEFKEENSLSHKRNERIIFRTSYRITTAEWQIAKFDKIFHNKSYVYSYHANYGPYYDNIIKSPLIIFKHRVSIRP